MYRGICSFVIGVVFAAVCAAEGLRLETLEWRFIGGSEQERIVQLGVTLKSRYSAVVSSRAYQCYLVSLGANSRGVPMGLLLSRLLYFPIDTTQGRICALTQAKLPPTVTRLYPLGITGVQRYSTSSHEMTIAPLPALEDLTFSPFPDRKPSRFVPPSQLPALTGSYPPFPDEYGPAEEHSRFIPLASQRDLRLAEWLLSRVDCSWPALGMKRPQLNEAPQAEQSESALPKTDARPAPTQEEVIAKRHFAPAGEPRSGAEELRGLFRVDFGSRLQGLQKPTVADLRIGEATAWAFPVEKRLRALDKYYILQTPKSQQVYAIWGMHTYPQATTSLREPSSEPVKEFETLVDIMTRFYGTFPGRSSWKDERLAAWNFRNGTLAIQLRSGADEDAQLIMLALDKELEQLASRERAQAEEMAKEATYLATDVALLGGYAESPPTPPPPATIPPRRSEVIRYRSAPQAERDEPSNDTQRLLAFDRYPEPTHRARIDFPANFAPLTAQSWTFDAAVDYRKQVGPLLLFHWGKARLEVALEENRVILRLNYRLLEKVPLNLKEASSVRLTLVYCQTKQGPRLYIYADGKILWFESLATANLDGLSRLHIQAPLSPEPGKRNGIRAWALYAQPINPKDLTAPQALTLPPQTE